MTTAPPLFAEAGVGTERFHAQHQHYHYLICMTTPAAYILRDNDMLGSFQQSTWNNPRIGDLEMLKLLLL
jgi:hypothetical protein